MTWMISRGIFITLADEKQPAGTAHTLVTGHADRPRAGAPWKAEAELGPGQGLAPGADPRWSESPRARAGGH